MAKTTRKVGIGTMTSRGQITVPKEIRNQLDLKEGEQLLFVTGDKGMLVRKIDAEEAIDAFYREIDKSDPEDIPLSKEEQEQMDRDEGYVPFEDFKRELGI